MPAQNYSINPIVQSEHFRIQLKTINAIDYICVAGSGKFEINLFSEDKSTVLATSGTDELMINMNHIGKNSFIIHISQERKFASYNFNLIQPSDK